MTNSNITNVTTIDAITKKGTLQYPLAPFWCDFF